MLYLTASSIYFNIMKIRSRSYLISIGLLALVYYTCANLFSWISGIAQNIMSPLWPEVGISQAVLFLGGVNLWPGIALGEFFDALKDGMPPIVAIFRGAIAASQALVGVFLFNHVHLRPNLARLRDVLALIGLGAIVATTILPTLQTLLLCFIQDIPWTSFRVTWWYAWIGNAAAIVVIVPVIFTVTSHWQELQLWFKVNKKPGPIWEAIILIFLLTNVCYFIFASHLSPAMSGYPLDLIPFIFSIWAALRFGQTGTVCVNLWVSTIAIWGTAIRQNSFYVHTNTAEQVLLYLEAFIAVEAIVSLILASVVEERQKAADLLREKEASLAYAQRITHLGNWDVDLTTQTLYWSDEIYRIFGYTPREVPPSQELFHQALHPHDRDAVKESIEKAMKNQGLYSMDYRVMLPNGNERIVHSEFEVISDADQKPLRLIGTLQDITEQYQIKMALVQRESQLRELNSTLEEKVKKRTAELEIKNAELARSLQTIKDTQQKLIQSEKMSSLGQLVAGVAHEINNPVTFIYGNIEPINTYAKDLLYLLKLYAEELPEPSPQLQEEIENVDLDFIQEDLPKLLGSMQSGVDRIRKIVLTLRNFSRLDEADMKPVDIHEGIESSLLILQSRLNPSEQNQGIIVTTDYGELPQIECYAGQLNQVFMNILTNAIDAIEEKYMKLEETLSYRGEITINTQLVNPNTIKIEIRDNGIGIPDELKHRIFDPFFTTKEVGKGTGLAMSISYQIIVEKHQGKIEVFSVFGKETTFKIELPVTQK